MAMNQKGLFGGGNINPRASLFGMMSGGPPETFAPTTPIDTGDPAPMPKKGGGLFGSDGYGTAVMGGIADYLLQLNDMQPMYAPMLQQRNQRQQTMAQKAADRATQWEDFQRENQWKIEHPAPINNDTANDYAFWQQKLSPEEFATWKQNKVNPPQYRQGSDGQFYRIDTGASPAQLTQPVGKLTPVGGPTAPQSGGFR